jgi:hypothetical protein
MGHRHTGRQRSHRRHWILLLRLLYDYSRLLRCTRRRCLTFSWRNNTNRWIWLHAWRWHCTWQIRNNQRNLGSW